MGYDIFEQLKNKIPKHTVTCFVMGILVGIITHFYMFTHKLPNWDDANNIDTFGSGDYLGRWFLKCIHPLGGEYSIPAVHGFLFVFFLAISACLVLEIAQIKSTTGAILVPCLMLTFPSIACTMTFMFMAHTSGIGILMTCLAIYILRKYKYGWLPCGIMLICVLGIYQSYISIAIALMLMGMLVDLIKDKDVKKVFRHGILCVMVLGISVLIYMELSHIIYPNLDNETYGGVGNMGQIEIAQMPILIARCYKRFLEFFLWKPFAFMTSTAQITNIIVCVLAVGLFMYVVWKKEIYKDILRLVLSVVVCGFVPLAVAFIYFMAPEVDYSMLMLYSYVLIYVLVWALLEICMQMWNEQKESVVKCKSLKLVIVAITVIVMFVSAYADYLITNKAYLRMDFACERVKSYFNRVLVQVEMQDEYKNGDNVAILGEFYYKDNPSSVEIDLLDSDDLREMSGVALENGLITSGVRNNFIKDYVGFELTKLTKEQTEEIMNSTQYLEMPVYPEEGCVQKINDIWVVKMCN